MTITSDLQLSSLKSQTENCPRGWFLTFTYLTFQEVYILSVIHKHCEYQILQILRISNIFWLTDMMLLACAKAQSSFS